MQPTFTGTDNVDTTIKMENRALTFTKDFCQPDPISKECRTEIDEILQSGRLFRYQGDAGFEKKVSMAEVEFAKFVGTKYALGTNSGGCALTIAIKIILDHITATDTSHITSNVQINNVVMTNAYTLAPVPGAIVHAGGHPVLIDCDQVSYSINFDDFKNIASKTGSRILLLCYMRSRVPEQLEDILAYCHQHDIFVIEDCAHTLGSKYQSKALGTLGDIGVFSLQTNKLINCGEGGFLCTNCPYIISRAIVFSGSYGHFGKHISRPDLFQLKGMYSDE